MEDRCQVNIEIRRSFSMGVMSGSALMDDHGQIVDIGDRDDERVADGVHAGSRGDGDRGGAVLLILEVESE